MRVLEADPELGRDLDTEVLEQAIRRTSASVMRLDSGPWIPPPWSASITQGFGLLILDGLLLRRLHQNGREGMELVSDGDLLRPWQRHDDTASVHQTTTWQVLRPSRLAVLDLDFARRASPYPQLAGALAGRALRRSRDLAVMMAIVQQPRVETRLCLLYWHLADQWGTVGPHGVTVPIVLSQAVLASLVAARRATVNTAISALERQGRITRTPQSWVLHGPPPDLSLPA